MPSKIKEYWKKIWNFIWHENSLLSWIVNVILAFILVKFIIYPLIGLFLSTSYPIVAVVSSSMEHSSNFDTWWNLNQNFYTEIGLSKTDFEKLPFHNGFNIGDIMILKGVKPKDIKIGTIIVYKESLHRNPIIHRVVSTSKNTDYHFQTKGDNVPIIQSFEQDITEDQIIGKAIFRIPYLGWVKIWFSNIFLGGT